MSETRSACLAEQPGELPCQPLPIRKLPGEGIGIGPVAGISPFSLLHALPDFPSERLCEGLCTVVAHAFVDPGVRRPFWCHPR